ncbi:MAG: tRNA uridine-5-carboxymethylaminomethyl(34) synthesis GTPase MnmE [Mycoplasmatales bacterium]
MTTVAQIATPVGEGGISIIKVSGEKAINSVNKIFKGKVSLTEVKSHTLTYGFILDNNLKLDEVLVAVMKAPHTYTGEDIVEINCHGGILITNKILKLLVNQGIDLAPAGEFTKRAFLNGKKNLDEVNTIMDLIHAKNEEALNIAINSLNNSSKLLIENLRESLLNIVTNVEVNIDYPEYEDLKVIKNEDIKLNIDSLITQIKDIIRDSKSGEIIKKGIQTAIIGKPNVGKSSILNYLSKNDKAIVTNIAGTTRDIIESEIQLDKLTLNLIDTAGIRATDDTVEQIGVQKSLAQINKAQLILFVLDKETTVTNEELEIINKIKASNKPFIVIVNKDDVLNNFNLEHLKLKDSQLIYMSTKNFYGQHELSDNIQKIFNLQYFDATNSKYLANLEHLLKLENILNSLIKVKADLENDLFLDLILIDLKEALFILSEILGLEVKDDYLNEIFSRFCLGK